MLSRCPFFAAAGSPSSPPGSLAHLREVKARFAGDRRVYDTFLEIMKEFKAQR